MKTIRYDSFSGTREIVFDKAIEIIAAIGFESMGLRDLAKAVGIKVPSLYNHFRSKQEILDCMYGYYRCHMFDNRPSIEQSRRVMESGDKDAIFSSIVFTFESTEEKKYLRMVLITKVILMRLFKDKQASHIFMQLNCEDATNYVKELLEYGISIGRLERFDVDTYTQFLIGQRIFMAIKAFASPDYAVGQLEEELHINKLLKEFLPLKR